MTYTEAINENDPNHNGNNSEQQSRIHLNTRMPTLKILRNGNVRLSTVKIKL